MSNDLLYNHRTYASKLLLFGEYTVLTGSKSLAIPFDNFDLRIAQNGKNNFEGIVEDFFHFLSEQDFSPFSIRFRASSYRNFFEKGYFLQSNIPIGYGLGSSGAVTAAVYELFFEKSPASPSLKEMKMLLASIENFFHGQSSGMDPLIIFLDEALISHPDRSIERFSFNPAVFGEQQVALIDSGTGRSTSKYVNIFRKKLEDIPYRDGYIRELTRVNNRIIEGISSQRYFPELFELLKEISSIQFNAFSEMIPAATIRDIWKTTLSNDKHAVKLCGAGGGGFFFLFSYDLQAIQSQFPEVPITNIRF